MCTQAYDFIYFMFLTRYFWGKNFFKPKVMDQYFLLTYAMY